jgi:hypothetical protein
VAALPPRRCRTRDRTRNAARPVPLLVACVALVTACSSGVSTIDALVQETCAGAAIDRDPTTVFAAAEARCTDGRAITWFATTADRDAWTTVAESVAERTGTPFVVLDRGRYHVIHTESADLPLGRGSEGGAASAPDRPAPATDGSSSATALQLEPDGEPYFGTVRLTAGFPDDPHVVDILAGGAVEAAALPAGCVGNMGTRPDVVLVYTAGRFPLSFTATSDDDLTLVIRTPEGRYLCDDDTFGLDPAVLIESPSSGRYAIWVGTYGSDFADAELRISELLSDLT